MSDGVAEESLENDLCRLWDASMNMVYVCHKGEVPLEPHSTIFAIFLSIFPTCSIYM